MFDFPFHYIQFIASILGKKSTNNITQCQIHGQMSCLLSSDRGYVQLFKDHRANSLYGDLLFEVIVAMHHKKDTSFQPHYLERLTDSSNLQKSAKFWHLTKKKFVYVLKSNRFLFIASLIGANVTEIYHTLQLI